MNSTMLTSLGWGETGVSMPYFYEDG